MININPLFTIHAGEFVFAEHVEKHFAKLKIWIPTKDTGVDFLLTNEYFQKSISVQVKMSRDYRPQIAQTDFERSLKVRGWFRFDHKSLAESKADLWSLILIFHERKSNPVFINISPKELLERLILIHGEKLTYDLYPWVAEVKKSNGTELFCIDGRGLNKQDKESFARGKFDSKRELT